MSGKNDNSNNNIARRHTFPPLRKAWSQGNDQAQPEGTGVYHQQLMAGFQQGVSDGFEQGKEQG